MFKAPHLLSVMIISAALVVVDGLCACSASAGPLADLYSATGGNATWSSRWQVNSGDAPCNFAGVTCESDGSLTMLLGSFGLRGTIPDTMSQLGGLVRGFSAENNSLTGVLPPSLSSWVNIKTLRLSGNSLTGSLPPSFASWSNILEFFVDSNRLTGTIPAVYEQWPLVTDFRIHANAIAGTLPPSFGAAWGSLISFFVSLTNITGPLPSEYSNWRKITTFTVEGTHVNGTLPEAYQDWAGSIKEFNIGFTSISGTLPGGYGSWSGLTHLRAQSTNLSGTIPDSYRHWNNVVQVYLERNPGLTGTLPVALSEWKSIVEFTIPFCNFYGTLPSSYALWGNTLTIFRVRGNRFEGTLPKVYSAWVNLTYFVVRENLGLIGTLPAEYAAWTKLVLVDVHNCSFHGQLPSEFGVWTQMEEARFSQNNFSGTLPVAYGSWVKLINLVIDNNRLLTGPLPREYAAWTRCMQIFATNCSLTGAIPPEFTALRSMRVFSISSNRISGTLPALAGWVSVEQIYLSQNDVTGTIPNSWPVTMCGTLALLIAAGNRLTGTLPADFSRCSKLSVFAVSQNDITGSLPSAWTSTTMPRLVGLSLQDNPRIYGSIPKTWASIVNPVIGLLMLCNTSICGSAASINLLFGFACVPPDRMFEMYDELSTATDAESYSVVRSMCTYSNNAPCTANSTTLAPRTSAPPRPTAMAVEGPASLHRAEVGGATALIVGVAVGALMPAVSSLTLSPAAGGFPMLQGAMGALRLRSRCSSGNGGASDDSVGPAQSLPVVDSPTQWCLEQFSATHACAAGGVLGNGFLVLGVGCVMHAIAAYVRPWCVGSADDARGTTTLASWAKELLPTDLLPGSGYWIFGFLLQPTVSAAVVLLGPPSMSETSVGTHVALGVAALLLVGACVVWVFWRVLRGIVVMPSATKALTPRAMFPFSAVQHARSASNSTRSSLTRSTYAATMLRHYRKWHDMIVFPQWQWRLSVPPPAQPSCSVVRQAAAQFGHRYAAFFAGYRGGRWRMFFAVEVGAAILCGVAVGVAEAMINATTNGDACDSAASAAACAVAMVSFVLALVVTRVRPVGNKVGNISLVVVSALSGGSAVASAFPPDNDGAATVANTMAFAAALVELVLVVLGLLSAAVERMLSRNECCAPPQSVRWRQETTTRSEAAQRPLRHTGAVPAHKTNDHWMPESLESGAPPSLRTSTTATQHDVLRHLVKLAACAGARRRKK